MSLDEPLRFQPLPFRKVWGVKNPADVMTKNLTEKVTEQHLVTLGQRKRDGRAQTGLRL